MSNKDIKQSKLSEAEIVDSITTHLANEFFGEGSKQTDRFKQVMNPIIEEYLKYKVFQDADLQTNYKDTLGNTKPYTTDVFRLKVFGTRDNFTLNESDKSTFYATIKAVTDEMLLEKGVGVISNLQVRKLF